MTSLKRALMTVLEKSHAAGGANPKAVLWQGTDGFDARCARADWHRAKLTVLILEDSCGRCNPEPSIGCFGDRSWRCRRRKRYRREVLSIEAKKVVAGQNNETAGVFCGEGEDNVGQGIVAKGIFCVLDEAIGGSDPERSSSVLDDAAGVAAGEGRGVFVVEDFEVDAVEAGDAVFGSYPDIAVAGLKDLVNAVLRKSILRRPGLMAEAVQHGNRPDPVGSAEVCQRPRLVAGQRMIAAEFRR